MTMDTEGPFEQYDQLVSPDEDTHLEVTAVQDGWASALVGGAQVRDIKRLSKWLLEHGWKIHRQTGHGGYEEIDHDV